MNFEQLLEEVKKNNTVKLKKKNKKFFEFQVENIYFYDLIIFQNINVKIINVPFEDKTLTFEDLNVEKSLDYRDFFIIFFILILSYFFIVEFFTIWYKDNIAPSSLNSDNLSFLNNTFISILSQNFSSSEKIKVLNIVFNSTLVDFLNFYGYLN